ncbi:hypothetical protein DM01DRAFT_263781, partial [Hesseltinella vesiculosa]
MSALPTLLPSPSSLPSRQSSLRLGTLNCRGLAKISKPDTQQHFIRFLRNHNFSILALQETHANSDTVISSF